MLISLNLAFHCFDILWKMYITSVGGIYHLARQILTVVKVVPKSHFYNVSLNALFYVHVYSIIVSKLLYILF